MNISRQLFTVTYSFCLLVFTGCATSGSDQMPSMVELQQRAQNGDAVAQRELGEMFDFGNDTKRDYVQAAKWYQMAADQGDAKAQNNLGSLYQYGLGVATNYNKAFELYKKSANQGFAMAQNNLGYMYDLGLGVPMDEATADSWYQRAAEQGYPEAMMNLGMSYVTGTGVDKDLSQGFMWLDLARFFTQQSPDMKTKWKIRGLLDKLKEHMTPAQIREGERRTKEWYGQYAKAHKQ